MGRKISQRKPRTPYVPRPPSKLKARLDVLGITNKQLLAELSAAVPETANYTAMQPTRWGQGTPVRTPVAAWLVQRLQVATPEDLGLVLRPCPSEHPLVRWFWTHTGGDWPAGLAAWAERLELHHDKLALLRVGWQRKDRRARSHQITRALVEKLIAAGAPDPGELEIDGQRVPWVTLTADW